MNPNINMTNELQRARGAYDPSRHKWKTRIEEHGWLLVDIPEAGYTFTVGLINHYIGEICVCGWVSRDRQRLLRLLVDDLKMKVRVPDFKFRLENDDSEGNPLACYMLRRIASLSVADHFRILVEAFHEVIPPVYQVFYTDPSGGFPWDAQARVDYQDYHRKQTLFSPHCWNLVAPGIKANPATEISLTIWANSTMDGTTS